MTERLWISTTIKKFWLDKILSGEKTSELKVATEFWEKRIPKIIHHMSNGGKAAISLLCGNPNHPTKPGICAKYEIKKITIVLDAAPKNIDGVWTHKWFRIDLGSRLYERMNKLCRRCGHQVVMKDVDKCRFCGGYLEPIGEPFWS